LTERVPRVLLGALVLLFAFAYALLGIVRHRHFGSSAYDLGIFDQAVWHLSRFEAPASTISGFSNILGDHFYPIIALFAPLYWIAPRPETLIVATADHAHASQAIFPASEKGHSPGIYSTLTTREGAVLTINYGTNYIGDKQSHSGTQVRVAAQGPGAEGVVGLIDHTDVFRVIVRALHRGLPAK
jgi:uncharacterized membrane protein